MQYQAFSAVLCLVGLACAVLFFVLAGRAQRYKRCAYHLFCQAVGFVFGLAMLRALLQALNPYSCARLSQGSLLLVGALVFLHVGFLISLAVWIKRQKTKERGA